MIGVVTRALEHSAQLTGHAPAREQQCQGGHDEREIGEARLIVANRRQREPDQHQSSAHPEHPPAASEHPAGHTRQPQQRDDGHSLGPEADHEQGGEAGQRLLEHQPASAGQGELHEGGEDDDPQADQGQSRSVGQILGVDDEDDSAQPHRRARQRRRAPSAQHLLRNLGDLTHNQ